MTIRLSSHPQAAARAAELDVFLRKAAAMAADSRQHGRPCSRELAELEDAARKFAIAIGVLEVER